MGRRNDAAGNRRLKTREANEMKIHHIGIAVDSLEAAVPVFAKILGCQPKSQETVEEQRVRVALFELENARV